MKIEFDPRKDASNRQKHGVSLADAALMDLEAAFVVPDERRAYGELRFRAYGVIGARMHMLVFTMRGEVLRAISLRKANGKEIRTYGQKARSRDDR